MNYAIRLLVSFVVVFHTAAFALEALLWMRPGVYEAILPRLSPLTAVDAHDQALILQVLFVNQGFYNLFLAGIGLVGLILMARGKIAAGRALIAALCLVAVGAGLVLLLTTQAYIGAALQAVPAAIALVLLRRDDPAAM